MNITSQPAPRISVSHPWRLGSVSAGLAFVSAALMFSTGSARADQTREPGYCATHQQECAAGAERLKQRCADDPAACEKARGRLQDLKARCDADPAACEQKKEQFRERRDELKARCDADPTACEEKKREFRDRLKERRDAKVSPAGQTPPIIPPKPDR